MRMQRMLSTATRKQNYFSCCTRVWCRGVSLNGSSLTDVPEGLSPASFRLRQGGPARTRFAPSPTGYLHLGSLRTALFNYLVAKATGGQFLLRIEDTDQKRTVPDAEEKIIEYLNWAGIQWDEGPNVGGPYGPYKQSQRLSIYREHSEKLLNSGHAYRCFCSTERLNTLAKTFEKANISGTYDRRCAYLPEEHSAERAAKGEAHVIRLKMPDAPPDFQDIVYGYVQGRRISRNRRQLHGVFQDPVIIKADGFPTYHLANVVDDHLMKITHVVRGSEWLLSTQAHVAMYDALGWQPPSFAHVCLLVNRDQQKLSKRHGAMDLASYRHETGVFPETLVNFVALLGWSHDKRGDVMNLEDLISHASLKYTKANAVVAFEKLDFLQKRHAARYASLYTSGDAQGPSQDLMELAVRPMFKLLEEDPGFTAAKEALYSKRFTQSSQQSYIHSILLVDADNYVSPRQFLTRSRFFFQAPTTIELTSKPPALNLHKVPATIDPVVRPEQLIGVFAGFADIEDWDPTEMKTWVNSMIEQLAVGRTISLRGQDETHMAVRKAYTHLIHAALRWAIQAGAPGPDGTETMKLLGRDETLKRLRLAGRVLNAWQEKGDVGSMDI